MKMYLGLFVTLLLTRTHNVAEAFGVVGVGMSRSRVASSSSTSTMLHSTTNSPASYSDAIKAAKEATKKFGPRSKEAQRAWEVVEEFDDASDDSVIERYYTPELMMDLIQKGRQDYLAQIVSLHYLLKDNAEKLQQMKALVSNIKQLEISNPKLFKLDSDDAALKKAIAAARAAVDVHGADSPEAVAAWKDLERCADDAGSCNVEGDPSTKYSAAALKSHHLYDALIDTKLLQDAVEAFDSIQQLSDYVGLEKKRLNKK